MRSAGLLAATERPFVIVYAAVSCFEGAILVGHLIGRVLAGGQLDMRYHIARLEHP
jgi:hypothetical protein